MPTATAAEPTARPRSSPPAVRIAAAARRPVPADSAALFRILFGLLALFGALRFLVKGWVETLYLAPENHLTYPGFDWVRPLPPVAMHLHLVVLAGLGLAIATGYRHRLAAGLYVVGFAYIELIDASLYLNHYWYVTLAGVLLAVLPVHHHWSLDARAGRVTGSSTVPAAVVWALRAQVAVVYGFAGLAKINPDWVLHALPMRLWLADRGDVPLVGGLLALPATAYLASWAGLFFDCTVVGWLLWRRSRPWAYVALVVFHLATGYLFPIGVFPIVMIAGALVFFDPGWPTRLARTSPVRPETIAEAPRLGRWTSVFLIGFAMLQLALPLRHYTRPGNVRWNEDGYYLSWRVMLTEKAGFLEFEVTDPSTGQVWEVGPEVVLTDWQTTQAAIRPDLIRATARLIEDHYQEQGFGDLEVRADALVSMNGRPARPIVDPTVDLS